jgi:PAS domain S-box-containing protein
MKYSFAQLIDVAMLQELMDDFYMVTGIPSGICDNASHMFTATGWKRVCTQFHRVNPITLAHCLKSDQYILDHLHEGPFVGYRCPHGLFDYAVPLFIEGEHLANVMTGQMFHEPPDLDFFRAQAMEYGFDEDDYIRAVQEIPIVPQERIAHVMAFLMCLTQTLAKVGLSRLHRLEVEGQRLEDARLLVLEREQAAEVIRQSHNMLTQIMNSVPQAIFWKARDYTYLGCNKVFADTLGLRSPEEIAGKTDFDLPWPIEEAEAYRAFDREVFASNQPRFHIIEPVQRADGTRLMVDTSKVPLTDAKGEPYALLGVYEDITERLRNEQELGRYRNQLEELVDDRTAELRNEIAQRELVQEALLQAKDAAEAANRAKSVFLANMSHELRTPLNAVLGFTQILRNNPELSESQKDNLDIILRSGEHLLGLINDVLDISRIETGQITVAETAFDLFGTLQSVRDMMRTRAKAKGLQFIMELDQALPRYIKGDEKRFKQVILNLAGNAVKFTDTGGVAMRVRESDGFLHVEVEDTGPGIAAEFVPKLFERFEQGGARKEGAGLGLYISRKLVEMMGGAITVKTEVGRGSLFAFSIRCIPADNAQAAPEKPRRFVTGLAPGQPHVRILVVEDTYESRVLIKTMLELAGIEVLEAANGKEGLRMFAAHAPDLVLMDMRMPVMDGYEAIERIKASAQGKKTPIIAVTASAFEEDRQKVLASGADEFIRKPILANELFAKIQERLHIVFLYVEESQSMAASVDKSSAKSMAEGLPRELTGQLKEALTVLDLHTFEGFLPEVAKHAPQLAEALKQLSHGYEVSMLMDILGKGSETP